MPCRCSIRKRPRSWFDSKGYLLSNKINKNSIWECSLKNLINPWSSKKAKVFRASWHWDLKENFLYGSAKWRLIFSLNFDFILIIKYGIKMAKDLDKENLEDHNGLRHNKKSTWQTIKFSTTSWVSYTKVLQRLNQWKTIF